MVWQSHWLPKSRVKKLGVRWWRWFQSEQRSLVTCTVVAGCTLALRWGGLWQSGELAMLDQLFRLRPPEGLSDRITIVAIDEADLQKVGQWPIPDQVMADLLQKIQGYQPRAIGLDIYRDLPVPPGEKAMSQTLKTIPTLIGIEKLPDAQSSGVAPPAELRDRNQVGFNNVVVDGDGKVRRSLLYWHVQGKPRKSFALSLAFLYLEKENISPQRATVNSNYLQLNQAVFRRLDSYDGGYVRLDARGYQIISNLQRPGRFATIPFSDVLQGNVRPELLRDRIVLIGSTASSLQDFFYTSYSNTLLNSAQPISGVELHANFISEILEAALDGRPLIHTLPEGIEIIWIWCWSWLGTVVAWRLRSPQKSTLMLFLMGLGLGIICYGAFLGGWWLPLVPGAIALFGSGVAITGYLAHLEEELKRSKEFLQSIINTIADPVFVKDQNHRWIILNQAYCEFSGYPLTRLLNRSDQEIFPLPEAEVFFKHDMQVFQTQRSQEDEEQLTDAQGNIHYIATKRSLHQDAGGHIFLVGVIRDITERKRMEEELKRTASELIRSNEELKLSEDRLRHLAYHDPLTGLPNRKCFYERLQQAIEWSSQGQQLVALLFLDLDGFKQVNDLQGHAMGDLLLKSVAQRLTACLRGSDTVCRLGGDEFTVILPGIPKLQDAARVAEKILATLSQMYSFQDHHLQVTVSIGISVYPLDGDTVDDLIKRADMAMYQAKERGRNQYYLATDL